MTQFYGKYNEDIWDLVGDMDIMIYVVMQRKDNGKLIYVQDGVKLNGQMYRIVRPFIAKEDAEAHLKTFDDENLLVKSGTLADLTGIMEKYKFKTKLNDVKVVLSAIDARNKIFDIETVWTFFKN